ncbi:MAG: hypothetical protein LBL94_09205 [Prevotellaceae bacterium]|jgi:hypothetical protein|nr:hypothetical protein [Prevotellaceae bacterium]
MKKVILISAFLGLATTYSYGQTYYYKCVASFDKDGVKSACDKLDIITFINNKRMCYPSDKDGNKLYNAVAAVTFSFIETLNGSTHVYHGKRDVINLLYNPYIGGSRYHQVDYYMYFSSDFNQLRNVGSATDGSYTEYKRTTPEEEKRNKYDDSKIPVF